MATWTPAQLKTELLRREHEYLDAVQSKDGETAARLTAPGSLVVSGHGAMKVDAPAITKMVAEHDGSQRYELDDASAQVVAASDDVAIISYKLVTTASNGDTNDAYDTDVWVQHDGQWKCALHTEIPAQATVGG